MAPRMQNLWRRADRRPRGRPASVRRGRGPAASGPAASALGPRKPRGRRSEPRSPRTAARRTAIAPSWSRAAAIVSIPVLAALLGASVAPPPAAPADAGAPTSAPAVAAASPATPAPQSPAAARQRLTQQTDGPAAEQKPTTLPYMVLPGDNLTSIAATFGIRLSALEQQNGLTNRSILRPGEMLTIPLGATAATPSAAAGRATSPAAGARSGGKPLAWPVHGVITSPFGWRVNPLPPGGYDFHFGIDIGVPTGTPVHAACAGTVTLAAWDGGYGFAVEVRCVGGLLTLYAHNSKLEVRQGQTVAQGETLSSSGMTGNATGPHVHFGVMQGGKWQNPLNYLP